MDFQKPITKDTDPCNDIATMQSEPIITATVPLSIADAAAAARTAAAAAEAAAAAAATAIAAAKEAAAKLAEAEAAAAAKAEEAAAAAAKTLAEAKAARDTARERVNAARSECDNFLKDSTGAADKVAKATELVQTFQKLHKEWQDAGKVYEDAAKIEHPFQVPRLRVEVAKLEGEIKELEIKYEDKLQEMKNQDKLIEEARPHSTQQSRSHGGAFHTLQNRQHQLLAESKSILQQKATKVCELAQVRQQLIAAEVAAGIRFANNHAPHHEMIIRAGMNGGGNNVMCSCGGQLRWTIESAYPPNCGRESQKCGKAGW